MDKNKKQFTRGYVSALVQLIYQQGGRTPATDELFNWKLGSVSMAVEAGCSQHDVNVLMQYYSKEGTKEMSEKVYHRNKGIPVEKRLASGELVDTYDSLYQAMRAEHLGYERLKPAVDNKTEINGHVFSFVPRPDAPCDEKEKKKKKPNASHPVVKRLPDGTQVKTYSRMVDAMAAEGISHRVLKAALENGKVINGYRYSYLVPRPVDNDHHAGRQKWEGADGMFKVAGWASLTMHA